MEPSPTMRLADYKYPDFDKVFEHVRKEGKLSKKDKLIFGGMSSSDCVEKLALAAHKKGFEAYIDSAITELFYVNLQMMMGHGEKPMMWFERVPIDRKALIKKSLWRALETELYSAAIVKPRAYANISAGLVLVNALELRVLDVVTG